MEKEEGEIGKQLSNIESQNKSDGVDNTLTTQQGLTGSDMAVGSEGMPKLSSGEAKISPGSPEKSFIILCEDCKIELPSHFSRCEKCGSESYHLTKTIEMKNE